MEVFFSSVFVFLQIFPIQEGHLGIHTKSPPLPCSFPLLYYFITIDSALLMPFAKASGEAFPCTGICIDCASCSKPSDAVELNGVWETALWNLRMGSWFVPLRYSTLNVMGIWMVINHSVREYQVSLPQQWMSICSSPTRIWLCAALFVSRVMLFLLWKSWKYCMYFSQNILLSNPFPFPHVCTTLPCALHPALQRTVPNWQRKMLLQKTTFFIGQMCFWVYILQFLHHWY